MENNHKFIVKNGILNIHSKIGEIIKWDINTSKFIPGYASTDDSINLIKAFLAGYNTPKELDEINHYNVYVITNLAIKYNVIEQDKLADDEIYEKGKFLYKEFLNSEYNNEDKSEYDCIIDFLKNYQKIHYELWDNRTNRRIINDNELTNIHHFLLRIKSLTGKTRENVIIAIESKNMIMLHDNIKHLGYKVLKINNLN